MLGNRNTRWNGGQCTFTVKLGSDKKTHTANTIEWDLHSGMVAPVSDFSHVPPAGLELRITYRSQFVVKNITNRPPGTFDDDDFCVEPIFESLTSRRLLPGVVVIFFPLATRRKQRNHGP